jgi:hypothetical protein
VADVRGIQVRIFKGDPDDVVVGVLQHLIVWEGKALSGGAVLVDPDEIVGIEIADENETDVAQWGAMPWDDPEASDGS